MACYPIGGYAAHWRCQLMMETTQNVIGRYKPELVCSALPLRQDLDYWQLVFVVNHPIAGQQTISTKAHAISHRQVAQASKAQFLCSSAQLAFQAFLIRVQANMH